MARQPIAISAGQRVLLNKAQIQRKALLKDTTIRDFSGGWNVIDNDLNLSPRFAKRLQNFQRNPDGSLSVRPGTRLFADTSAYIDEILNMWYFNGVLVVCGRNGKLVKVDSVGNVGLIWDSEIAGKLPGSPDGWSVDLSIATAAEFDGELIVCNGVDKPLLVASNHLTSFLRDKADLTNANTPIGKYVTAHDNFLVITGIPGNEDRISISNSATSGTWFGDSGPNDGVNVDLGTKVPSGSSSIRGLGRFRDKLIVAFDEALLPGNLGVFNDDGDHIPTFLDAIEEHGSIGHRVIQSLGEDMLFADTVGVPSVRRALFTGEVQPERLSQLIDPEIQLSLSKLGTQDAIENRTWSLYDSQDYNYMLFIPNATGRAEQTETRCFVYKQITSLKVTAWFEWLGWNFTSSTKSSLKRVFHSQDTLIFLQGNERDPIYRDFEGDQDTFDDDTTFSDYTGWTPVADESDSGLPISFTWEQPWFDNDRRFNTKESRHINFDVAGKGEFTAKFFIDNIYNDVSDVGESFQDGTPFDDDLGWDVDVLDPALSMSFVGRDDLGSGAEGFGTGGFGGGRPTVDERLYAFTTKYKIGKFQIDGETMKELKIVSQTHSYLDGSIRR